MPEKPLRIIHCFRSPVGGIFRHVRDLVDMHHDKGHEVGILCDSMTGTEYEEALFEKISPKLKLGLMRMPMRRAIVPSDMLAMRKIYKEIKELQPDIFHGHGAKGGAYVRIIGSLLRGSKSRVTRIYSPHGGSLHYDPKSLKGRIFFNIERFFERFTDKLVFVSDFERQTYHTKVGVPKSEHCLIYNGLNDDEFVPVVANKDASDFLYIGMMRDLKGPDVFINALRIAEKLVGRPLTATMVGDGPDKEQYIKMRDKAGLVGRIDVHKSMPARDAFKLAKYVIVPSRAEAMPYIVLETVAAQKPIISTNVGGIPEILGADSDVMVPPGDADRLSAVMALAIEEKGWIEAQQPKPNEFYGKFSAQKMAADMLDAYRAS